jgi:hypothetical protein
MVDMRREKELWAKERAQEPAEQKERLGRQWWV